MKKDIKVIHLQNQKEKEMVYLKNKLKTNHYVYKITNLINGKIYVGRRSTSLNIESDPYFGSGGKYYQNALKKYGINNFKKEIIEICNSFDNLCEREEFWIISLNSCNQDIGYNATTISNGFACGDKNPMYGVAQCGKDNPHYGEKHSEETKQKIRLKVSGENSPSHKLKGENHFNRGKKLSEEHKLAISKNSGSRKMKGEFHFNKGRKKTEEQIERIRISSTGRNHEEKTKELLRQQRLGVKFSEEHKINISNARKKLKNIICPHCGKESNSTAMYYWHFDNCKEKEENKNEEFLKSRKERHSCLGKPSPLKGTKRTATKIKCPYCGVEGGISNMKRYHFENCKYKN